MEVFVGFGAGVVTVYLLFLYEARRARPNFDPEPPDLRLLVLPDGRIVASLSDELLAKFTAAIETVITDEWCDEEARALEAAEAILRGEQS
jgi:hypothetical protein